MDYKKIENEVKKFCEKLYSDASEMDNVAGIRNLRAMSFGALMFACNELFPCFNDDLSEWWNDEMWYKFEYLITKIKEER